MRMKTPFIKDAIIKEKAHSVLMCCMCDMACMSYMGSMRGGGECYVGRRWGWSRSQLAVNIETPCSMGYFLPCENSKRIKGQLNEI